MTGSPWQPSWTSLTTKAPIVDYLGTLCFHLNCRTALVVRRHLKKKPIKAKQCMATYSYSVFTVTPTWHTLSLWSALCCLIVSSAVSIASRLALAAKILLQTIPKELLYNVQHAEGFVKDLHPFRRLPIRRLSIGRLINSHIRVITCARARRSATIECYAAVFQQRLYHGKPYFQRHRQWCISDIPWKVTWFPVE